jgi:hypothetical protein
LKIALSDKGEEERQEAKSNFLRNSRFRSGEQEGQEEEKKYAKKKNDKYKLVEEIGKERKKWANEDEGYDIDTYEATYDPT